MTEKLSLQRSTPEAQGISSDAIATWVGRIAKLQHPNSFMLLRNGFIIAEGWWYPYNPKDRHMLFSLSKSFVSFGIGFAIAEGLLKLDDKVVSFFKDSLPSTMEDSFNRMTIRHLLTMSSGHSGCLLMQSLAVPNGDCVKMFLSSHLEFEPGTRFVYNSFATYMLSVILTKVSGKGLVDYLKPRLLEPLGIERPYWDTCQKGFAIGGWGFHLNTVEIANFAQLLLDGGRWNGKQLIPEDYFKLATSFQIDNSMNESPDWKLGYGFQFWRSQHNAFRGDGAFGQYALAIPEANIALATTSGMSNMQDILTSVWEDLLPHAGSKPLPENPAAVERLRSLCSSLRMPLAKGDAASKISGCHSFLIQDNALGVEKIDLLISKESCEVVLSTDKDKESFKAGFGRSILGMEFLYYKAKRKIGASAAWKDSSTLEIVACYYETPFIVIFTAHFEGGKLRFESSSALKFGTTDWPVLEGSER